MPACARISVVIAISLLALMAEEKGESKQENKQGDRQETAWHLGHPTTTGHHGTGAQIVFDDWNLKEPDQPIIVAVIDTGLDLDHPAFAGVLWHNESEIRGAPGVDDDGNGYVDDVHGWNYLSGPDGTDLRSARLEITRLYAAMQREVELQQRDAQDPAWKSLQSSFEQQRQMWLSRYSQAYQLQAHWRQARSDLAALGLDPDNDAALEAFVPATAVGHAAKQSWLLKNTANDMFGTPELLLQYAGTAVDVWYNPTFSEAAILGDVADDPSAVGYGKGDIDIDGETMHGTLVAGVIGAQPWPGSTMRGICPWVEIMSLRAVPNGDERDKDIAAAVRYAVAHGAQVICMSFGKSHSAQPQWVEAAMQEAAAADVVLVHAAGNDGADIDATDNYPTPFYFAANGDRKRVATWLEVGASQPEREQLVAPFSNYGFETVDLFAPGTAVAAPVPGGDQGQSDGTSLAAPLVAGTAALLRSQFPQANAEQVVAAILAGVRLYPDLKVRRPKDRRRVSFASLSRSGGVLDIPGALQALAEAMGQPQRFQ